MRMRMSVLMVMCGGACLAMAAPAGAAPYVFGSDLQHPANLALGCDQQPQIVDTDGNMQLVASGQPDCTWRFAGVFGVTSTSDTRGSTVPGDGTITQAEVRSGPNPAPLRFVILQQVESVCCYFVSETKPIPMTPNAITQVPLDLAVERNSIGGVQVYDFVAVSADAGKGSLPLFTNGHTNAFQQTENGNPSSGLFYPRMGSVSGDGRPGGGRHEQGAPGTELLVRWTWKAPPDPIVPEPPAQMTPPGATTLPTDDSVAPTLVSRDLRAQNARTTIQLLCKGNVACAGQLVLTRRTGTRAATASAAVYAKASYTLAPGARAKIKLVLNAKGKAQLKRHRTLKLTLRLTPKGGKAKSAPVTLRR